MREKAEGRITITSLGTGYLSTDRSQDIYIPSHFTDTALNGDIVEVALEGDGLRGEVTKIISRKKTQFVGTMERRKGDPFGFVTADDYKIHTPFFVPSIKKEIKDGTKVLIELVKWVDPKKNPVGKIIKVLGKKGDNDVEMESIVLDKGFEIDFAEPIERESKKIKKDQAEITKREIGKRKDFRDLLTFTIDPNDAKDFDDAISYKKLTDNLFEVGVHIADVGFWVKERSAIDREARKRGFSLYLVDRTVPMLPEVLSNDICSLNPQEDKLTFSAVFKIDSQGNVKERWFGKTVIKSKRRFNYKEVQDIIDGKLEDPLSPELKSLNSLTQKMRKKRVDAGAIEFSCDELKIELDNKGRPIKISVEEGLESQKLIEDLMILANREVALYVGGEKNKRSCLYRIHEKPDRDSLDELFTFLKKLGYQIKMTGKTASSKDLNKLIDQINGTDREFMVKTTIIRSMPKAIYSTVNRGHFAMALAHYTHFTSPIRRYSDLLVHRLLQKRLEGKTPSGADNAFYKETAEKLSQKEIDLASAERISIALKQTEYMMQKIGQTREGIISGVTEWGIYIQDLETQAEGMVKLKSMKNDFYTLDKQSFSIVGTRTKKRYSLGDRVKVKILGGDLERKSLDLAFI